MKSDNMWFFVKSDNMWFFVIFSVSIIFLRFLHVVVRISISFLFLLNNAPLHEFHLIYPFISRWTFGSSFCEPWAVVLPPASPETAWPLHARRTTVPATWDLSPVGHPHCIPDSQGEGMPRLHPRSITAASLGGGPRHQPLSSSQVVTSTANCESHSVSV